MLKYDILLMLLLFDEVFYLFINLRLPPTLKIRTCLHWACKRNHKHIVTYLLTCGADKEILTAKDELASQLTSKPEIKRLLGGKQRFSYSLFPASLTCFLHHSCY